MALLLAPVKLDANTDADWSDDGDDNVATPKKKTSNLASHQRLLNKISALDQVSLSDKKIKRVGPVGKIDDQEAAGSQGKSVSVSALLKKFDNTVQDKALKQRLKAKKEAKVLAEPLRANEAAKQQRSAAYQEVTKDLKKWDPIISENRGAEGVSFPLDQTKLKIQTTSEYVQRYTRKTAFEQEIENLVGMSRNNMTKSTILTEAEKEALAAMSFEEASFRRQELQKSRALLSYKEQKARWQSKIKSKGYHRHLRRQKKKIEEKEFEELKNRDPEAAAVKLAEMDQERIEERMTLKHRGMGKWAKRTASRAKNDRGAREQLQEHLRLSRSITTKQKVDERDDEELKDMDSEKLVQIDPEDNPWEEVINSDVWEHDEIDKNFGELEDFEEEQERIELTKANARKPKKIPAPLASRSRPPPKNQNQDRSPSPDFEAYSRLVDGGEEVEDSTNVVRQPMSKGISSQFQPDNSSHQNSIVNVSSSMVNVRKTATGWEAELSDGESDDEQRKLIAEAFADDDVIGEFRREKMDLEDQEAPKDIDLTLPGWGDWAGAGIGPNKKKKKFIVKAPKRKTRKDKYLTNVIISERQDEKVVPHQVKELPFPFTTVAQFHSAVRAPIGKTWNTESAFEELTRPKISTKMGTIIRPLDKKSALRKAKRKEMEDDFVDGGLSVEKKSSGMESTDKSTKNGKVGLKSALKKRKL